MEGKRCPQCGRENVPEAEFCIRCGSPLEWVEPSALRLMRRQLGEIAGQLTDPIFAFLKTTWLVFTHPRQLAESLARRDPPAAQLPFPLHGLWRLFSPDGVPYIHTPVEFFFAAIVLHFLIGGFTAEIEDFATETATLFADLPFATALTANEMDMVANFALQLMVLLLFSVILPLTLLIVQGYRLWMGHHRSEAEQVFWGRMAYFYWFYTISGWLILSMVLDALMPGGMSDEVYALVAAIYFFALPPFVFAKGGWKRSLGAWLTAAAIAGVGLLLWNFVGMAVVATLYAFLMLGLVAMLALPSWLTYLCLLPLTLGLGVGLLWLYRRFTARKAASPPPQVGDKPAHEETT